MVITLNRQGGGGELGLHLFLKEQRLLKELFLLELHYAESVGQMFVLLVETSIFLLKRYGNGVPVLIWGGWGTRAIVSLAFLVVFPFTLPLPLRRF